MLRKSLAAPLLAIPLVLLLVVFFMLPFLEIMRASFTGERGVIGALGWLTSPVFSVVFLNTLQMAVTVTLICLILGYPTACFIALQPSSKRGLYQALVLLPFWTSVLVRTYTWSLVLGREGLLNATLIWLGILDVPQRFMFTPLAVYLGMIQILLPIAILTLVSVMTELDFGLVRAARILGASPARAFWHVFLPMTKSGIVAAALLLFILSLGFYITPALLGGPRHRTIANLIDLQVHQMNDWATAAVLALVLLLTTIVVVALLRWFVPERNLHGGAQ